MESALSVEVFSKPASVVAGTAVDYEVVVVNSGPSDVAGITVVADIPTGLDAGSARFSASSAPSCRVTTARTVNCSIDRLSLDAAFVFSLAVRFTTLPSVTDTIVFDVAVTAAQPAVAARGSTSTPVRPCVLCGGEWWGVGGLVAVRGCSAWWNTSPVAERRAGAAPGKVCGVGCGGGQWV